MFDAPELNNILDTKSYHPALVVYCEHRVKAIAFVTQTKDAFEWIYCRELYRLVTYDAEKLLSRIKL